MRGDLREEINIEEMPKEVKLNNLILDERNSSPIYAHYLSVLILCGTTDFEPPVLWLDGSNSFNPYLISEISRNLELRSEQTLQDIYISRAFTCYQMISLVLEKLEEAIKKFDSKFIVITGLPKLFLDSDLSETEALQAFNPLVKKLKNLGKLGLKIFLASEKSGEKKENRFISRIESASDTIIKSNEKENLIKNRSKTVTHFKRNNASSESNGRNLSLEEFA